MKHRPDIDGLRAVAVIPVLLFHMGLGCPGGYVGVDVFFVISGYLITALILQALAEDRFTLVEFWQRRVRRIAPALVVVVAATLMAGWFLLLPDDFRRLGNSTIAQTLLAANFYSLATGGYFDTASELNPLLHTWSLAVEEQFYLLLPLLLGWLWRRARPATTWVLGALCCASLIVSIPGAFWFPRLTFYLLPTRAWELLLGSLLAAAPLSSTHRHVRESAGVVGLGCILLAAFAYDHTTPFPGIAAMLPCLGTVAVLWANASHVTWAGRLLTTSPMVFVGRISYSLYLWHWPLVVYAKYWSSGELPMTRRWMLLIATIGAAVLSWRFVELPFRLSRTLVTPWRVFAPAGAAFATLTVFGAVILLEKGMPWRLPAEAVAYGEARHAYEPLHEVSLRESRAGRFVDIGSGIASQAVEVFLWGDSHAMAVVPAVRDLCRQHGVHGLAATHSATPPVIGLHGLSGGPFYADAVEYNQCVLDFIVHNRIPHVVLVARWSFYESYVRDRAPRGSEILRERLQATVDALVAAGSRVYVMQEVPCHPTDVPRALAKAVMAGQRPETLQLPESRYREEMAAANAIVHAVRGPSVQLLDPSPWLTDGRGLCRVTHDGQPLYRDDDHLSIAGAMELRPMFDRILVPGMAEGGHTRAGTRIIR